MTRSTSTWSSTTPSTCRWPGFPACAERTIRISSAGKTFSATGWKIGWALGPAELITGVTAVKQFLTYVSGAPFQPAVARALNEGDDWVAQSRQCSCRPSATGWPPACATVGLEPHIPRGTYFMTTDVRPLGYADGVEFCRDLPERCGVVAIPHQVFYDRVEAGPPVRALGLLQVRRRAGRGDPPAGPADRGARRWRWPRSATGSNPLDPATRLAEVLMPRGRERVTPPPPGR